MPVSFASPFPFVAASVAAEGEQEDPALLVTTLTVRGLLGSIMWSSLVVGAGGSLLTNVGCKEVGSTPRISPSPPACTAQEQELPPASGAATGEPSVHVLTLEVVDQDNGETVASSADFMPGLQQQAPQGSGAEAEEAESKERHPIDPVAPEQPPAIAVDPMPATTEAVAAAPTPAGGNNRLLRGEGRGPRR